ncbi:helix-turn-helix domain-containing protein [Rhizobium sp.]
MSGNKFANVWDALEDTPGEAAHMKLKSNLLHDLQRQITGWNLTQIEAAKRLGVTQPRLNDLLKGRISKFSLDMLVDISSRAGLKVEITTRQVETA